MTRPSVGVSTLPDGFRVQVSYPDGRAVRTAFGEFKCLSEPSGRSRLGRWAPTPKTIAPWADQLTIRAYSKRDAIAEAAAIITAYLVVNSRTTAEAVKGW